MADQSLSGVFLGLGGGVVTSLGVAASAVGTLFAVNRLSNVGIKGLEALPGWLGMGNNRALPSGGNDDNQNNDEEHSITKYSVGRELGTYAKIAGVIVAGVGLRYLGNKMSSPEAATTFNNLLSGKLQ